MEPKTSQAAIFANRSSSTAALLTREWGTQNRESYGKVFKDSIKDVDKSIGAGRPSLTFKLSQSPHQVSGKINTTQSPGSDYPTYASATTKNNDNVRRTTLNQIDRGMFNPIKGTMMT